MKKKEKSVHKKAPPDINGIRSLDSGLEQRTDAEPALVDVHSEGSYEARLQVVLQRPRIAWRPEVPADQRAIHSSIGQDGLRPRVEVMHVHDTAVLLLVQGSKKIHKTKGKHFSGHRKHTTGLH